MPFLPWKKVKNNRISKLVNDHLQKSQMRRDGSSLVVETGFATSLVDLFIKNREKLKKPSRKKRKSSPIITASGHGGGGGQAMPAEITPSPFPLEVEQPPSPPSAKTPLSCCPSPLQSPPPSPSKDVVGAILVLRNNNVDRDGSEVYEERAGIFMIILKMFLVVVLGLGTKRLALGITMAACFLFFLEYVMKLSSVKAKTLPRFWRLLRSEVGVVNSKSDALAAKIEKDEFLRPSGSSPMISESRHDGVQEIQAAEEIRLSENEQDIEHRKDEFVSESKKMKKSRRAAMKSKVKKLMANKKFDSLRKVHEIKKVAKEESETVSGFSSPSSSAQKEEDNNRVSEVKEKTTDFGPSLRFLAVLCLIILIGLVQSRLTALVLALFSCVLLRLCEPLSNFLS